MNAEDAKRLQDIIYRAYQNDWITDSEADHLENVVERTIR